MIQHSSASIGCVFKELLSHTLLWFLEWFFSSWPAVNLPSKVDCTRVLDRLNIVRKVNKCSVIWLPTVTTMNCFPFCVQFNWDEHTSPGQQRCCRKHMSPATQKPHVPQNSWQLRIHYAWLHHISVDFSWPFALGHSPGSLKSYWKKI